MKLVLDLLGPPRLMGARQRVDLRAGSLSIGRSPEADWVISDTDRLISRLHLRIDASHGDFVLTDTSANGVYVNGGGEPVGYGASVKLRDGDRLRVGEAQIAVAIEAGQSAAPGPSAATPFALDADAFAAQLAPPAAPRDPLGGPFGSVPAVPGRGTELPVARTVIDANWMKEPAETAAPAQDAAPVSREDARQDMRQERGRPVILPLRPGAQISAGQATPLRAVPSHAPEPPSLLALVDARPDLSIRRLAAAVDAAGQAMDPQAWRDLHEKIKSFAQNDSIQPPPDRGNDHEGGHRA